MNSVLEKLKWRAEFLLNPREYVSRNWNPPEHRAMREALLDEVVATRPAGRLRMLGPGADIVDVATWMRRRVREDEGGRPYIDLGRFRLYYLPQDRNVDDDEALRGAMFVIKEAFVSGPGFFTEGMTLPPEATILDLGANLGTSAILFSELLGPDGMIYSFEPVFHELLEENIVENGIPNVEVIPKAVGAAVGDAPFSVTDFGLDSRRSLYSAEPNYGVLPMTTIDAFAEERGLGRVDFIKLDIEGGEEEALRGGRDTIARFRPRMTIASYHTDPSGEPQHPKLVSLLHDWSYRTREVANERIYAWPEERGGMA